MAKEGLSALRALAVLASSLHAVDSSRPGPQTAQTQHHSSNHILFLLCSSYRAFVLALEVKCEVYDPTLLPGTTQPTYSAL